MVFLSVWIRSLIMTAGEWLLLSLNNSNTWPMKMANEKVVLWILSSDYCGSTAVYLSSPA